MEHLTFKAVATATDQGVFQAVISTATIDREKDIVDPQAMVDALQKWVPTGKKVPLRWNHGTRPEHIVGHIDPASARVVNDEVVVDGWVDQKAKLGGDAWRLVKSGTLGFSFGYLITDSTDRPGGGRHIKGMDVFEVTATHAPMNGDTRVLGWKSGEVDEVLEQLRKVQERLDTLEKAVGGSNLDELLERVEKALENPEGSKAEEANGEHARSADPLRKQAEAVALEFASGGESLRKPPRKVAPEPPELIPLPDLRRRMRDEMLQALSGEKP